METPEALNKLADRQEYQAAKVFFRALKTQYTELAAQYEAGNELKPNKEVIKKALVTVHGKIQLEMAEWQFNQLNKQVSVKALQVGVEQRVLDAIRLWILGNTGASITSISNTTLDIVRKVISQGQANGFGARKIGKLIRDEANSQFTAYRSTVIARTEGTRAASEGARIGAKQWENITGQTKWKAWSASSDSRTRDQHLAMIGSLPIIGTGAFTVGGKQMQGPGDPNGGATNCVNCRCRIVYMSERVAKTFGAKIPDVQKPIEKVEVVKPIKSPATKPAKPIIEQPKPVINKEEEQLVLAELPDHIKEDYNSDIKKKKIAQKLKPVEGMAIHSYSSFEYEFMNNNLRGNDKGLTTAYKKYLNAASNQINNGLDKLPKFEGNVYRATMALKDTDLSKYEAAFKTGKPHIETAFMSTSPQLQQGFGSKTIFKIKSKNGVNISELSASPEENEVLFKHGSQFKVTSFREQNGQTLIEMEEL